MAESDEPRLERVRQRRRANLKRAMAVRQVRADLKRKLRAGEVDRVKLAGGQLDEWEDVIATWRLEQLLASIPGIGSVYAQEIFERGPFSPAQRVRSLSPTRRKQLARLVSQVPVPASVK